MFYKRVFLSSLIVSTLLAPIAEAQEMITTYKNQRGSVLEIQKLADNMITGYFTTAVASKTCPQAINQKRPITGYMIGNAMSFSIFYPMCDSVLSIAGNISADGTAIDTLSILNKQAEDVTKEGPGARYIGHDTYQKVK